MQNLLWVTADLNSSLYKAAKEKHFRAFYKNSSFRQSQCLNCSTLQIGISWYDLQAGFYPLPFGAACNWGNGTLNIGGLPGLGEGSADPCCYICFFPCFSFCSRRLPLFAKDTISWKVFSNKRYTLAFPAFCMSFLFISEKSQCWWQGGTGCRGSGTFLEFAHVGSSVELMLISQKRTFCFGMPALSVPACLQLLH